MNDMTIYRVDKDPFSSRAFYPVRYQEDLTAPEGHVRLFAGAEEKLPLPAPGMALNTAFPDVENRARAFLETIRIVRKRKCRCAEFPPPCIYRSNEVNLAANVTADDQCVVCYEVQLLVLVELPVRFKLLPGGGFQPFPNLNCLGLQLLPLRVSQSLEFIFRPDLSARHSFFVPLAFFSCIFGVFAL